MMKCVCKWTKEEKKKEEEEKKEKEKEKVWKEAVVEVSKVGCRAGTPANERPASWAGRPMGV